MPINSQVAMSNTITFTNHQFFKKETEYDQYQYELEDVESMRWISIDKTFESKPYAFPLKKPQVKSQILF